MEDVQIRGNDFKNAAYAGEVAISISPHICDKEAVYHKNIVIEENFFEMHEERFLYAANVENLIFRNNRFRENLSLPAHGKLGNNGIETGNGCRNIAIEPVKKITV